MSEWRRDNGELTIPVFVPGDSFLVFSRAGTPHVYRVSLTGRLQLIANPPGDRAEADGD